MNFAFYILMLIIYDTMQFKFRISNSKISNKQYNICRSWSKPVSNAMARVYPLNFLYKLVYEIKFDAPIRGHHARRLSIKYKYPPSSIIVVDGMVSNTKIHWQGAKSICLKTTGHEKCMISVCLAAKADRNKLKPFAVFRAAKRESKS